MNLESGRAHYKDNDTKTQQEDPVVISDMLTTIYDETNSELVQDIPNSYVCLTQAEYEKCLKEYTILTEYKETVNRLNKNQTSQIYNIFKTFEKGDRDHKISFIILDFLQGNNIYRFESLNLNPSDYIDDVNIARKYFNRMKTTSYFDKDTFTREVYNSNSNHKLNDETYKKMLRDKIFSDLEDKEIGDFNTHNQKYIDSLKLSDVKTFELMYKPRGILNNESTEVAFYSSMTIGDPPLPLPPKKKETPKKVVVKEPPTVVPKQVQADTTPPTIEPIPTERETVVNDVKEWVTAYEKQGVVTKVLDKKTNTPVSLEAYKAFKEYLEDKGDGKANWVLFRNEYCEIIDDIFVLKQ